MYYTYLTQRELLFLSGSDVISFLQGLVTQDMQLLAQGKPAYAALLTPQGKYLHDFFLFPHEGEVILDGEHARMDDLQARLKLYKLRSDVKMERRSLEGGVVALWGEDKIQDGLSAVVMADPRVAALGWRAVGCVESLLAACKERGYQHASEEDYDKMRLALGVPDGSRDMIPDKSLMLECGMDKLNAISFSKGCYIGQEVTARSKHRGQVRKTLYSVKAQQELPEAGTAVVLGDTQVGELRSHRGNIGIAMIRTEAVGQGEKLLAHGVELEVSAPAWA